MWAPSVSIVALLTIIPFAASAGFNPKTDSCVPRSTTYASAPGKKACKTYFVDSDFAVFDCDNSRRFSYDIKQNQVRMIVSNAQQDGYFNVHAECVVNGKVAKTYDLHVPIIKDENYNKVYAGFASACKIGVSGTQIRVASFGLTRQALGQCSLKPIKPITQQ